MFKRSGIVFSAGCFFSVFVVCLFFNSPSSGSSAINTKVEDKSGQHVGIFEFGFELSEDLHKGSNTISIHNIGGISHEMVIIRLQGENTVEEYIEIFKTGGSLIGVGRGIGGIPSIAIGEKTEFSIELEKWNYFITCFKEDDKSGTPHLLHGMYYAFTID